MLIDNMLAYSEVLKILSLLEDEYVEKVPEKVKKFFEEERMKDYEPDIKVDIPLTEQNLKRETMVLLAILNLNYWCNSEEEKQSFLNELAENEKEKKELEEKYNPDNLFKNRAKNSNANDLYEENLQMIEYKKPNFIQRLLGKIAKFFKK